MGEFPNKASQFSKTNQPPPENKSKPKSLKSVDILNKFLSVEKDMVNPLTGLEGKLSIAELMHLKQIANAVQGDISAYKEIIDRLEGKAKQNVDLNAQIEQKTTVIRVKKRDE
jgi:hypothetical protein